jgi:glutamyl-tRNA synthetase
MDVLVGPCSDEVAADGDLPIRDRDGHWTYAFSVVVDDLRQGVDLVIRGRDLLGSTAVQVRLGARLGRETAATFAHHALVRRHDGRKLSKADADTSVRDLRTAGHTAEDVIGAAAHTVGLTAEPRPRRAEDILDLVRA